MLVSYLFFTLSIYLYILFWLPVKKIKCKETRPRIQTKTKTNVNKPWPKLWNWRKQKKREGEGSEDHQMQLFRVLLSPGQWKTCKNGAILTLYDENGKLDSGVGDYGSN